MASINLAGDTSGTITLSAPAVSGATTLTLPATTGTVLNDATVGVCRAWVNFNGTGTVAIRASFNVSSITDNGVGDYTVNFTNVLSDANYCVNSSSGDDGSWSILTHVKSLASMTTNGVGITLNQTNLTGAKIDFAFVLVSVFR